MTADSLVSIGIPTYNRAAELTRAVESVLAQTHRNLELVISDNASSDLTESACIDFCERDSRVRYLRSPVNRGPTANFNTLFRELAGDHLMLLSDDDWLDHSYVETCLAELSRRPDHVLICGIAHYLRDGVVVREGVDMQLAADSPHRRVVRYLREVDENGVFYGLMPRAVLQRAAPMRNVLGNDWLLTAAIAAQGKVATLPTTSINRELDGTSADFAKLAKTLELPSGQARIPHLVIAWETFKDIGWRTDAYRDLTTGARARLALAGAFATIRWRSLAWHLTMPTFMALSRRPGGRWLGEAYLRFTRLLGAGRSN